MVEQSEQIKLCAWNLKDSQMNFQKSLNLHLEENLSPALGHLSG
jgi:hypothetical protein